MRGRHAIEMDQFKKVEVGKDYFLLFVNKAQLILLPFKIFQFRERAQIFDEYLRTKGLIK